MLFFVKERQMTMKKYKYLDFLYFSCVCKKNLSTLYLFKMYY